MINTDNWFDWYKMNLQLFGGGGSKSGLGGGGDNVENKKINGPGYYLFYFEQQGAQYYGGKGQYRFIRGKDINDAIREAEKFGNSKKMLPSQPMTGPMTKEEARKWADERRKNKK